MTLERKKEDQYRYGHKHTYNQIFHNLNTEIEAPFVCVCFILFFYLQMALYITKFIQELTPCFFSFSKFRNRIKCSRSGKLG